MKNKKDEIISSNGCCVRKAKVKLGEIAYTTETAPPKKAAT